MKTPTDKPTTTASATPDKVRRKVEFDYDQDADMSWLDQDEFRQEKPEDHIALQMSVYEFNEDNDDWTLVDSLGGIDCLKDADDWATGTFYRANDLPEGYLRELATERLQGEYGAAASLRTIPAEKPTAIQTSQPYNEEAIEAINDALYAPTDYKAHADKLAEALNVAQATIERLKQRYALGSVDGTLDVIFKALAAYEESR